MKRILLTISMICACTSAQVLAMDDNLAALRRQRDQALAVASRLAASNERFERQSDQRRRTQGGGRHGGRRQQNDDNTGWLQWILSDKRVQGAAISTLTGIAVRLAWGTGKVGVKTAYTYCTSGGSPEAAAKVLVASTMQEFRSALTAGAAAAIVGPLMPCPIRNIV